MSENDQLRARIAELEHQQIECEEKLADMVAQAKEYATRLQQAQDTIHNLSEPRLQEEDRSPNMTSSFSSSTQEGVKESEITKARKRYEFQAT